ncbi:hypothetical protein FK529_04860 [Tsukamurella asaccharolytica]|uniref:Asp23/Gls24 family envelope stress response protein n=1 Tax=Tsukamurella asaccharolytica TaxID=2592067 RepID=A0A5C5RDN8_9ACTN|nr:hypothetical protein [Tsukamurella asaccharolytica]TWS20674.1 hypothetical protein FK529_04860 [Tsukamurella asaccharolytica]
MSGEHADIVDRVVDAVTSVDGVAGIHAGGPGSPATYLPGRTVSGVRITDEGGQVDVVLELRRGTDLLDLADRVRQAATDAAGVPIDLVVSDIAVPGDPDRGSPTTSKEFIA